VGAGAGQMALQRIEQGRAERRDDVRAAGLGFRRG
jgi:hypothetical protein